MRSTITLIGRIAAVSLLGAILFIRFPVGARGTPLPTWSLIWADDFEGSSLEARRWVIADRKHPNYDGGINYYDPQEVSVQDGNLVIQSHPRGVGRDGKPAYSSGRVSTQGKFAFLYGKLEIRAKLPGTQGIWPAIWMLPADKSWPPEIDLFELIGSDPRRIYMTHHWGNRRQDFHHTTEFAGPDFTGDFHVFSIEWEPGRIRWLVDDVECKVETAHVPGKAMYLIVNTSIGGDFAGLPDESSVFPATLQIDYVRIYQHPRKRR